MQSVNWLNTDRWTVQCLECGRTGREATGHGVAVLSFVKNPRESGCEIAPENVLHITPEEVGW